jgi:xanthine dehydrogenase accessory factor
MHASAISQSFLEQLSRYLERKEPLVLLTVIGRSGSGPREAGAMMIVDGEGGCFGTIGGGILEARAKTLAQKVLLASRPAVGHYRLTNHDASDLGMICGGRMEILADYIPGSGSLWPAFVKHLADQCRNGRIACLVRSITGEGNEISTGLGMADEENFHSGSLDLSGFDPETITPVRLKEGTQLLTRGNVRYFIQPAGIPGTVHIFGAGHVGEALAPLCHFVGFRTVIVDDRSDFANRERFPVADEIHVPETFEAFLAGFEVTESDYIVIVTRGHDHDQTVLVRALGTSAGYIGMIASRRKRDTVYRALMDGGWREQDLKRIHSPIGLDIGARTPEEIAVSIVAELIAAGASCAAGNVGVTS